MPKYGLIACFSPVITVEWVSDCRFGVSPVNYPDPDPEHKFDGYQFGKNWELENGKKIGVLAIQKVAKTGNIGIKLQWQAISIM